MDKIVTFGEVMLRLKAPGRERLLRRATLEVSFGGGEANVAVSLAQFGLDAEFVTALPDNPVADACIAELHSEGVGTRYIKRSGQRMGIYFLETGASQRPSRVVYDRSGSSIACAGPGDMDWDEIFNGSSWLHVSGITAAISQSAADLMLEGMKRAKAADMTVSLDLNYRAKLWQYGKTVTEIMTPMMAFVDVVIAGKEDCQKVLGVDVTPAEIGELVGLAKYKALSSKMLTVFPNLKTVAITLRKSLTADHHRWSACLRDTSGFYAGPIYEITPIIDRVGTGDSFAAGLIFGIHSGYKPQAALDFAIAASCLKHSIPGDYNRVSRAEVEMLLAGDGSNRVQR